MLAIHTNGLFLIVCSVYAKYIQHLPRHQEYFDVRGGNGTLHYHWIDCQYGGIDGSMFLSQSKFIEEETTRKYGLDRVRLGPCS